jgi:hypothetical protein
MRLPRGQPLGHRPGDAKQQLGSAARGRRMQMAWRDQGNSALANERPPAGTWHVDGLPAGDGQLMSNSLPSGSLIATP